MTTDVRTLLQETAETPSRDPDIEGAMRSARARRRRQRGFSALVAVVVVALVTGFVAIDGGGGDEARVALAPRQSSEVPDGWKVLAVNPGITVAIPPDWDTYQFGQSDVAVTRVAVGTAPQDTDPVTGCPTVSSTAAAGLWVTLWEYPTTSATEVPGPAGGTLPVLPRPAHFGAWSGSGSCAGGQYVDVAFVDQGRTFVARVFDQPGPVLDDLQSELASIKSEADGLLTQMMSHPGDNAELQRQYDALLKEYDARYSDAQRARQPQLDLAVQVLDTLKVESLTDTTTTTALGVLPPPIQPTATTAAPFVPTSDDERAIVQVFGRWVDDHTDQELDATVEDPDAVRAPSHEGWDQHTPEDLAQYDGRVESIRLIDANHAEVVYTILHSGQVAFGNRTGSAVKVNGEWKVSTETVCSMLRIGGITCPA